VTRKNEGGSHLDKGSYCKFCGNWFGRMDRHFRGRHRSEIEVLRWLAQDAGAEKNKMLKELCNLGTHQHNLKVIQDGVGELLVQRCAKDGVIPDPRSYWPCDLCHVWYTQKQFRRHKCCAATPDKKPSRKFSKQIVAGAEAGVTDAMAKVLSCLAMDEIGITVRNDFLLREYLRFQTESELYVEKKCRDQLKIRLRYGGRLLLELRKDAPNSTLSELLTKKNFEKILLAARACSKGADGKIFYETSMKLGHVISDLINRAKVAAHHADDQERLQDLRDLEELKKMEWTVRIVKGAKYLITKRVTNQIICLPSTEHVVIFSKGLSRLLEEAIDLYGDNPTLEMYRRLQKILLIKIITFNR
jgi:hypothetical protein